MKQSVITWSRARRSYLPRQKCSSAFSNTTLICVFNTHSERFSELLPVPVETRSAEFPRKLCDMKQLGHMHSL